MHFCPIRTPAFVAAMLAAISLQPAHADPINTSESALTPFIIQQGDFKTLGLNYALAFTGIDTQVKQQDGVVWVLNNTATINGAGIDRAYTMPTGSATHPPDAYYFQPGMTATSGAGCTPSCSPFPDPPNLPFTGDTAVSWDARIAALNTALSGQSAVFYFFMNEVGQQTDVLFPATDELAWAKVTLVDDQDVLAPKTFYLTNIAAPTALNQGTGPDPSLGTCNVDPNNPYAGNPGGCTENIASGDPTTNQNGTPFADNADGRYTYVSGFFCVRAGGALEYYGRCTSSDPATDVNIENNLGNNQAGFAVWNDELGAIIANNGCVAGGCYDVLQGDVRLSMMDNGYESLMIAGSNLAPPVPEPSSLAVLGAALAGFGLFRSRRRRSV